MLRNYLVTALRNLARHRLYTAITVLGLGAAFAAAMLIGLYVRDEFSFEHFISGYQQVYRLETDIPAPGQKSQRTDAAASMAAADFALDFPQAQGVVRLMRSSQWVGRGEAKSWERVAWTDADFFKVLPYPVLAGDPVTALHDPDGVVLTRQAARKFFGVDAPIGRTLQLQSVQGDGPMATTHPMVVKAVLKDIPSATHLEQFKIYASGRASWSSQTADDKHPVRYPIYWTYVRLPPGVGADRLRAALPAFAARHYPGPLGWRFRLEPLKELHFVGDTRAVDAGIAAVGVLIILIAAINFVTLMTARAARRAVEVGVRKVAGARRADLMVQFMGETLILVLAAMLIGVVAVELALPAVNAFLRRTITLDFWDVPALAAAIVGGALLTGVVAGLYPALVLSSFRPAWALKAKSGQAVGSGGVRQGLVLVQFAILISLMIMGATIWRQTSFALQNLLRLNEDQIVYFADCDRPFKQALAGLPGVSETACVSNQAVGGSPFRGLVQDPARGNIPVDVAAADVGFFEMHGLKPLAGRFFSEAHGVDMVLDRPGASIGSQPSVVINESGMRRLGFRSPREAVGQSLNWSRGGGSGALLPPRSSEIVGVVQDFTIASSRTAIDPTLYYVDPAQGILFARLQGRRIPETLSAIDALWRRIGHVRPIKRDFLSTAMREDYRDVEVQGAIIGGSAGLAIVIACLGLFSMAAFTAERRTKEIGVRKAMGASAPDVVRLLLWQFTQPVLWANLAAWPLAFWAADHWLRGFAYRVSLPPWLFLSASAAAMLIALATVAAQAWTTARAKPVSALRYE